MNSTVIHEVKIKFMQERKRQKYTYLPLMRLFLADFRETSETMLINKIVCKVGCIR